MEMSLNYWGKNQPRDDEDGDAAGEWDQLVPFSSPFRKSLLRPS